MENEKFHKWNLYTPNIMANIRHAWLVVCAVRVIRKKFKLIYHVGDLVARNADEAAKALVMGSDGICV